MSDISINQTLGGRGADLTPGRGWALLEGATLGGYRVIRALGRGGMGEVYLVENVEMGKRYAMKLLRFDRAEPLAPPSPALQGEAGEAPKRRMVLNERFRQEARVMADLDHPGIVRVNYMAQEEGRHFLVMDYVEGPGGRGPLTLDALLKECGRLREDHARRITVELSEALAAAHEKGVIHRDLKPGNVLIDSDGRSKLTDFGLARVVGDDFLDGLTKRGFSLSTAGTARHGSPERGDGEKLSQSDHAIIGTYEYMSPEQKTGGTADERSDIYSLGLVIYRMLTGERAEGRFPLPSELGCSKAWDMVVERSLATKPENRFGSVRDILTRLDRGPGRDRSEEALDEGRSPASPAPSPPSAGMQGGLGGPERSRTAATEALRKERRAMFESMVEEAEKREKRGGRRKTSAARRPTPDRDRRRTADRDPARFALDIREEGIARQQVVEAYLAYVASVERARTIASYLALPVMGLAVPFWLVLGWGWGVASAVVLLLAVGIMDGAAVMGPKRHAKRNVSLIDAQFHLGADKMMDILCADSGIRVSDDLRDFVEAAWGNAALSRLDFAIRTAEALDENRPPASPAPSPPQ